MDRMLTTESNPMTVNRTVLCMKWGKLYSADYVNVLFNACRQHLAGDFRFLCLDAGLLDRQRRKSAQGDMRHANPERFKHHLRRHPNRPHLILEDGS